MTATALKKELIKAIGNINDAGFLQAVYTIVNDRNQKKEYDLSEEQWAEIERRKKNTGAGKARRLPGQKLKR